MSSLTLQISSALWLAKPPQGAEKPYFSVQELSRDVLLFFFMYPRKCSWGSSGLGKAITHKNVLVRGQTLFTHG